MEKKVNNKSTIFKLSLLITFLITIIVTTVILGNKSAVNAVSMYDSNSTRWVFNYNSSTLEITNLYCTDLGYADPENFVIPSTITYGGREYTVKTIGGTSSSTNYTFTRNIVNVTIPDTVTELSNYCFYYNSNLKTVTMGNNVKKIGTYAFYYCTGLESITLPEGLESIGNYAFYYCRGIAGNFVLPNSLTSITGNPFYGCSKFTGIKFGDGVPASVITNICASANITSIELYDDSELYKVEDGILFSKDGKRLYVATKIDFNNYVVPSTVTSIEANAFRYVKSMTGTLTLPEGLQSIGNYAFAEKSDLTGHLRIPDSVTTLGTSAFYQDKNFDRVTIGSGITSLGAYTFSGLTDLFVNNVIGSIEFNDYYCDTKPVVHFINSVKHVLVSKAPGIKLVNTETGAEIETGDYIDETTFRYRIEVENGYNYNNLQLIWYDDGKYENFTNEAVVLGQEYEFTPLLRERSIYVQNLNDAVDLSLRTFITEVNRNALAKTRVPEVTTDGAFEYLHTKEPVRVKRGDLVTYRIRVYNEALQTAKATEITVHIPEGMSFDAENATNKNNAWIKDGNTIKTSQLAFDDIHSYLGNGVVNYKDVDICLTVDEDSLEGEIYKTVFAEITRMTGTDDDSTPGNVSVSDNYRIEEIVNSNSTSYIAEQEDDDDFETVVLNSKIRVEYNLRIEKIDKDTDELLAGAKFELLSAGTNKLIIEGNELKEYADEEVIARVTSDENGIVDFGAITTYDEGENIFWVKEIDAPSGYLTNIGKKMKVKVVKTILDEEAGTYSVKVYCESSDYAVDTSHFEFTPVSNAEQLAKIGSGEIVNVDGVNYEYNIDSNYKLTNDIDLSGINWTPIDKSIVGIIDGDGHKISNLTIVLDETTTIPKVGLIGEFTGIIENLTLENPNIHMTTLAEGVTDTADYTGVGAFVGFMKQGYIYNCKTTVTEGATAGVTSGIDNIGGFVGHTGPNGLVTIINSENNIDVIGADLVNEPGITEVKGSDNVGGFIGCSLGSISIQNSKNTGKISCGRYGAGGLVGFVKPSDYEELSITAGYDEDNKRIDLLVENEAAKGQYNLTLEIRDKKTSRLIGGAIYEVDKIEDNIKTALIDTGSLKLFDKAIEYTGKDVYFMTEEETVPGYDLLTGIIRVDIDRYWDNEANTYKVRAEASIITHKDYEEFIGSRSTNEDEARTGKTFDKGVVFTEVNIERANWNGCKIEIANCINDGQIIAGYSNAGGMIGTSYGVVTIDNCINNGEINGTKKSGGMVAELKAINDTHYGDSEHPKPNLPQESLDYSMVTNCTNNGNILGSTGNTWGAGASGGLVGEVFGFIKVANGTNNGEVSTIGQLTGGLVGKTYGAVTIEDSVNNGTINISAVGENSSSSSTVAGGILGEAWFDEYGIEGIRYGQVNSVIRNCTNYGDLYNYGGYELGGIVGLAAGKSTTITNCQTLGASDEEKVKIQSTGQGSMAGIIAFSSCKTVTINDCKVKNMEIELLEGGGTQSNIAGIFAINDAGYIPAQNSYEMAKREVTTVSNCVVDNCIIIGKGKEVSGIMGITNGSYGYISDDYMANIHDCVVKNSLLAERGTGGNYPVVSGMYAGGYECRGFNIRYCNLEDSRLEIRGITEEDYSASTSTVSGIFGRGMYTKQTSIEDCNVINSTLYNKANVGTAGNTGGIYGICYGIYGDLTIKNCNVRNSEIIDYNTNAGGILGGLMNSGYNSSGDKRTLIENCNVIETNITRVGSEAQNTNDCCVGGIAGSIQDMNKVIIKDNKVIGKEIDRNAENASERNIISTTFGDIGGAVGMMRSNYAIVSNITIKNYDIIDNVEQNIDLNQTQLGGFCGSLWHGSSNEIETYKDITVENVNIKGNKTMNTAGFVASFYPNNNSIIENVKVKNASISSKNTSADSEWYGSVAGLVSTNGYVVKYKNCSVEDCEISSRNHMAAGAVAWSNSDINASNCSIKNVRIIDDWAEPENPEDIMEQIPYPRVYAGFSAAASNNVNLENITVANVSIDAKYASIGGIYGYAGTLKALKNCTVKDCEFTSTKSVNGIIGACAGLGANTSIMKGEPSDNKVSNVEITTDYHINAGMFGFIKNEDETPIIINNSTVENVTLTHENKPLLYNKDHREDDETVLVEYNPTMAGVVGITSSDITINNATVKDTAITAKNGSYTHIGGIIALTGHNINIDNAKVINTNITNNTSGGITGGLVGMNSYLMTDVGNPSPVTTITNSSIEQNSVITANNNFGGMVGYATVKMDKNKVLNTTLKANGYASSIGGVVGLVKYGQNSIANTTINALSIPDGEYTGANVGGVSAYINNGTVTNTTVTDSEIVASGCAAGLVAILYTPSDTINNATVTGSTITSKGSHAAGVTTIAFGIVSNVKVTDSTITGNQMAGGATGVNYNPIDEIEIEDTDVVSTAGNAAGVTVVGLRQSSNIKVKDSNVTGQMAAGVEFYASGMENAEVDNVNVTATTGHAGGVAVVLFQEVTTIRVKDSTIKGAQMSGQMAGGVSAFVGGDLNDIKVSNTSVIGSDDVGGIAGVLSGTLTDAEVKDSTIKAKRLAGGIVGTTEWEIKDATVDGSTIISEELHVGGIVACTKEKLNNCTTKNSTIKTLTGTFTSAGDVFPTCLGGLVGAGYKDTSTNELKPQIVNSTVENNTLAGATGTSVGKYIGGPIELNDQLVAAETTQP